jgi:hypothetical protein
MKINRILLINLWKLDKNFFKRLKDLIYTKKAKKCFDK